MCDICIFNPFSTLDGSHEAATSGPVPVFDTEPTANEEQRSFDNWSSTEPEDDGIVETNVERLTSEEQSGALMSSTVEEDLGTVFEFDGPMGTIDQMATFIAEGFWPTQRAWNLSDTGLHAKNGVLTFNVTGNTKDADGLSDDRADLAREIVKMYATITGIEFVETTDPDADINFFDNTDTGSGKVEFDLVDNQGVISSAAVGIPATVADGTSAYGSYAMTLMIHEFGHTLGMGHVGEYPLDSGAFANDSWHMSVMSYVAQGVNPNVKATTAMPTSLMAADIEALDILYTDQGYGSAPAFADDTVWGFNTTITEDESAIWHNLSDYAYYAAFTIHDTGGIDTLDFSGYLTRQVIDLTVTTGNATEPVASNIGTLTNNLSLSVGTVIENAVGGVAGDIIYGNQYDNVLYGGLGNDRIYGRHGDDTIYGGGGTSDRALFSASIDKFSATDHGTHIELVGEGTDLIYNDIEILEFGSESYTYAEALAILDDSNPDARDDAFTLDEGATVTGNLFADNGNGADSDPDGLAFSIIGVDGAAPGTFTTASGASVTVASDGSFTFVASADTSMSMFESTTDTFTYQVQSADGDTDVADVSFRIEGVNDAPIVRDIQATVSEDGTVTIAADFDDPDNGDLWAVTLGTFGVQGDVTNNYDGTFTYDPGYIFDGLDDGETAVETFEYSVTDLALVTRTAEVTVTVTGITNEVPGLLIDGTSGLDSLLGGAGDDTINGLDGADKIDGGDGDDLIDGGAGLDTIDGGEGADTIFGGDGIDIINGQGGDDTISGGNDIDSLFGGEGNDSLQGNGGYDWLHGDAGDDLLIGGGSDDKLFGGDGQDTLRGDRGRDALYGGADADTFVFTATSDADWIYGFEDGLDKIDLTALNTSFDDLTIRTWGSPTVLVDNIKIVFLESPGVTITEDDFIF